MDDVLLRFAAAVRAAGIPVSADRSRTFVRAVAVLGVRDGAGVFWAGRATLCSQPDHLAIYDRLFVSWFTAAGTPSLPLRPVSTPGTMLPPLREGPDSGAGAAGQDQAEVVRTRASDLDLLRRRDIAELSTAERRMLADLLAQVAVRPPRRRARRRVRARTGTWDVRGTLREQLRWAGEAGVLRYHRRADRPRRLVLLVDVSGSMNGYADALLRLAHRWVRAEPRHTEVFTVGTRLTRVTRALASPDVEVALRTAGEQVPDWSGGTRLGEVLKAFLDRWGRRGLARGAIVVIFSDGWERGDPALLSDQVARLQRLAHRVVWVNPHRGKAGYRPVQAGIVAALPYLDDFLAGHSLATFAELVEVVGRA